MFSKNGILKKVLIIATFVLFAGCSFLKLSYTYGDFYIMYKLDRYLDLNDLQEELAKKYLNELHSWHRQYELSRYSAYLTSAKVAIETDFNRKKLDQLYQQFQILREDLILKLIPYSADFFTQIDTEQLDYLEKKLTKENQKLKKEIHRSPGIKRENMMKEAKKSFEDWIGTLEPAQIKRIAKFIDNSPDYRTIQLPHRVDTQKIFFAELRRENRNLESNISLLTKLWVESYTDATVEYNQKRAIYQEDYKTLLMDLYHSLTLEQKNFLITKIRLLIKDLTELEKEG